MRLILAALLALAGPAAAEPVAVQDDAAPTGLVDIPLEEWTDMAAGRTLTYAIGGQLWAMERYHPGGNRVTIQFYDQTCLDGFWEYADPLYCFHWIGEGTSCFRHARLGDEILILETRNGAETGDVQRMTGVSDTPLNCSPGVS